MKTLIIAVLASAFSLGAMAAAHSEKGASAPMAKPMAAKSGEMAASGAKAKKAKAAKAAKKAASAPKA